MENEQLSVTDEKPLDPVPERPVVNEDRAASDAESAAPITTWLVAGLLAFIAINAFVLYITNSRITDLEVRLASLSNSAEAKAAKQPAPPRGSGPEPGKVYTVNTEGAPVKGEESAPVTIVEMSDFECPYCARVQPTLARVSEVYKDNVRLVWKHLPLQELHANAMPAAVAAEAAKKQGKFWEYHDKLFTSQRRFSASDLRQYAVELGLNMSKFDADMADPATKQRITDDAAEANALGVTGTPGFFINGRFLNGAQPFDSFAAAINGELKRLNLPVPQAVTQ